MVGLVGSKCEYYSSSPETVGLLDDSQRYGTHWNERFKGMQNVADICEYFSISLCIFKATILKGCRTLQIGDR